MKTVPNVRSLPAEPWSMPPWMLFPLVLTVILITEFVIMCVVPALLHRGMSMQTLAALDAFVLTFILSPLVWWLVVRPQQRITELRTRFIDDLISGVEDERRRIAHDLHDGVGQSLTLLISGLRTHPAVDAAVLQARDGDLLGFAQRALSDVRELSQQLRPSLLDHLGLIAAIDNTVAETRRHHSVQIDFTTTGPFKERLPEKIETNVFRIFQEALSNVIRHAEARNVVVLLSRLSDRVLLTVTDDGLGVDATAGGRGNRSGGGLGLRGMRERAIHLGGEFAVTLAPGGGTIVHVSIPLRNGGK